MVFDLIFNFKFSQLIDRLIGSFTGLLIDWVRCVVVCMNTCMCMYLGVYVLMCGYVRVSVDVDIDIDVPRYLFI